MFDLEKMRNVSQTLFTEQISSHYGADAVSGLERLLEALHEIHHWLAYELLTDLVVFVPLDAARVAAPGPSFVDVPPDQLPQFVIGEGTLMPLDTGEYRVWAAAVDAVVLAESSIVYRFSGADHFVVGAQLTPVVNPTGFPSIFGLPTFVDLQRAFDHYSSHLARYSTCKILCDCWFADKRVILANQPEQYMRRSLAQYLKSTLRDHEAVEVREEQIVDESHPVDIKVTWSLPHRLALIEIKWLGDCSNAAGDALSATKYRDARARDGAKQLCDYLDENKPHAPTHVTVGYLVVFDARRRGIENLESEQVLSQADAAFYRLVPVSYDPEWHLQRVDFAEPERIYLEPMV